MLHFQSEKKPGIKFPTWYLRKTDNNLQYGEKQKEQLQTEDRIKLLSGNPI